MAELTTDAFCTITELLCSILHIKYYSGLQVYTYGKFYNQPPLKVIRSHSKFSMARFVSTMYTDLNIDFTSHSSNFKYDICFTDKTKFRPLPLPIFTTNNIQKLEHRSFFSNIPTDYWILCMVVKSFEFSNIKSVYSLLKNGYIYKTIQETPICFICKKYIHRGTILRCGCVFHSNCIFSHFHDIYNKNIRVFLRHQDFMGPCPRCIHSSNIIKRQFKLSYCCPRYNLCKKRLLKDYQEISDEFERLVIARRH